MIDTYVPSGSSFSGDIDHLIFLVTAITGFWFLLAEAVRVVVLHQLGKARPGAVTGLLDPRRQLLQGLAGALVVAAPA